MWHEARKRDKETQQMVKNQRRRSEKRRAENRVDPASLLQIYGVKSKLSLDPDIYKQATKSLVPWQGDNNITIDRFDVRASLTSLKSSDLKNLHDDPNVRLSTVIDADESDSMKKLLNYERYRSLIQNELNGIPEEVGLKIVAKSESESDAAKMRKLQNNRFGTSGEASMPSIYHYQPVIRSSEQTSRIPPTIQNMKYSSVPPPTSQNITGNRLNNIISDSDNIKEHESSCAGSRMIDLDDYNDLDVNNVDHVMKNFKFFSCDEFLLLASKDQETNVNELLREMSKLSQKRKKDQGLYDEQGNLFYGPSIPPELIKPRDEAIPFKTPSDDEDDGLPVQQRSPSGADIPLRVDECHERVANQSLVRDDILESTNDRAPEIASPEETTNRNYRLEPRRASTPLIYKKNCRSERSISRERKYRRKRRRRSNRRRRTRSRS